MEQGTGCAGSGRMSKVAAEDERETCTFLPARGRFLLCNRGTQLGTMCWLRASSEPGFTTKTRERPPRPGEKERGKKKQKRERERRRDFTAVFLRYLTPLRFYGMHGGTCPFYELTEQVHARGEARMWNLVKGSLEWGITRLTFASLENIVG